MITDVQTVKLTHRDVSVGSLPYLLEYVGNSVHEYVVDPLIEKANTESMPIKFQLM